MGSIDVPTLVNWLVKGLISFVFGAGGAWVAYRLQVIQLKKTWAQEVTIREQEFARQLELEKTKLELARQAEREEREAKNRRDQLTKGLDDVDANMAKLMEMIEQLEGKAIPAPMPAPWSHLKEIRDTGGSAPELLRARRVAVVVGHVIGVCVLVALLLLR